MRARKALIVAVIAGGLFGLTAAAMAATGFEVPGTAKATGTVGTVQPTTGKGTIVGDVYPGHSNDCDITFANPNAVDVVITEIKGDGYDVVQSGPGYGQSAGPDVSSTPFGQINDVTGLNISVPKNGTKEAVVGNCLTAGDFPQDSQGTQFTIHFVTDGHSA
jgi:hypothetical protein